MGKSPACSHIPVTLPASLNQHLNLYALAASAAGVSLLALTQPSEAKIVYTKTHHVIGTDSIYPLDLNHDGTIDFVIKEWGNPSTRSGSNAVWVKEAFGNAVEGNRSQQRAWPLAAALRNGALIGAGKGFVSNSSAYGEAMLRAGCSGETGCWTYGHWLNVKNRYLGLKFQIDGKTHYGWARLSVQLRQYFQITATLTGYAYETIPRKGIRAGQTGSQPDGVTASADSAQSGNSPASVVKRPSGTLRPASLGRLSLGASGIPFWRRP